MPIPYTRGERLLDIRGVSHEFNGHKVLNNVTGHVDNLIREDVDQGQVLAILGPSGVGKSVLFSIIAGFRKPTQGDVLIHHPEHSGSKESALRPTKKGRVGVVMQNSRLFNHRTVRQNLIFAGRRSGLSPAESAEKADALLNRFSIFEQRDRWVGEISGGQRQRTAIIQQIMAGHTLICMDEPFASLDVNMTEEAVELVREITSVNELLTVLVVTHDIGAAISVADHMWLMGAARNEADERVGGSTVVMTYDLISMNLAWQENISSLPDYQHLLGDITERFKTLA